MGSQPISLHQITVLLGPLPGRNNLAFWGPLPTSSISWTCNTSSSATYEGLWWLLASHRPLHWSGVWCTWRISLFPVDVHTLGTQLPPPPMPPPLPVVLYYCWCPSCRLRLWDGGGSSPPMARKSHRRGIGVRGGYIPSEWLLCTACGCALRKSVGWCVLMPAPCIPPLYTPPTRPPEGRITFIAWGMGGVGWPPTEVPDLSHAMPGGVPPETPPPIMMHTLGTLLAPAVYPVRMVPPPLLSSCKPLHSVLQSIYRADIPSPLYYWCY